MNGERLLTDHLRSHSAIEALGARLLNSAPGQAKSATAWVQVTTLNDPQMDAADHNRNYLFQVDCYAGRTGGIPEVNALSDAVRTALLDLQGTHDEGVSSRPWVTGGPRLLDTDYEPAREHKPLTVEVVMHP